MGNGCKKVDKASEPKYAPRVWYGSSTPVSGYYFSQEETMNRCTGRGEVDIRETHYVEGPGIDGKIDIAVSWQSYDCEGYDKEEICSGFRAVQHTNGHDVVIEYHSKHNGSQETVITIPQKKEPSVEQKTQNLVKEEPISEEDHIEDAPEQIEKEKPIYQIDSPAPDVQPQDEEPNLQVHQSTFNKNDLASINPVAFA